MPPVIYLIDGHALAYRTYFALTAGGTGRFQTQSGEPTAGIFGFVSVILKILDTDKPDYLAVAFDTGKTFRNDLFPDYKATRAKMPDDLKPQIERIRQLIDVFPFPRLEVEGYEADDVLGSVAQHAVEKGLGVKIITGDRDLLQLVTDSIVVNLAGAKLSEAKDYFPKDVKEYLGVLPEQVVDYKALVGDQSDNIPGVQGVGEKTAVSLLNQYPTLEDIYSHLDELPARVKTRLEAGRDSAEMSRTLAAIRTDLPVTLDLEKARIDQFDKEAVLKIFRELEFRTLTTRFLAICNQAAPAEPASQLSLFGEPVTSIGQPAAADISTIVVDNPAALEKLVEKLEQAEMIALDTETTSTDPMRAKLVGISLAVDPREGYYIPVGHTGGESQLPMVKVADALKPVLESNARKIAGHNLKYDWLVLAQHGITIPQVHFDTMIAEWLTNPSSHNLGLKDMAEVYLHKQMTHIEELIGKGKNQLSMAEVPVEKAAPYAAADAAVTFALVPALTEKLQRQNATELFHTLEMPLVTVLGRMEQNGITLDIPFFGKMAAELNTRLAEIEDEITRAIGYKLNINSTQQLSKALFETLKLEPPDRRQKTASGMYSTAAEVLELIRSQHPVIGLILEYRELAKLKSTYVDTLPLQVNPKTGRVHTSFNQTGSVTGRLASSEPNLQNIPVRTDLGRKVRNGFIAGEGQVFLSVDYSQIELRIVAHMAQDEAMLNAFRNGQDIHAATAAAINNIPLEKVTKSLRSRAKAINFGLIYGMSSFGLSRSAEITLAEAEDFVRAYFNQFPGVKRYLDSVKLQASRQGYVETLLGRRRYFPNLQNQSNVNIRNREEREAINAPVQGTAADIIKLAMLKLPGALLHAGLNAKIVLQVHDELLLECPVEELPQTAQVVQQVMEKAYTLSIPLETDARSGKNWGELETLSNA
ncbi:MAG: DNA polymerase I [bacterium]